MSAPREVIARYIGQSGWVRPVNGDNDRAWQLMLREADGILEALASDECASEIAEERPVTPDPLLGRRSE